MRSHSRRHLDNDGQRSADDLRWLGLLSVVLVVASACGEVRPPCPSCSARDGEPVTLDGGSESGVTPPDGSLPELTLGARVVFWVGAHPDDESMVAPLMSDWCSRTRCVFLVLTRGEGGHCGLPSGCAPSLGAVRTLEMQASARLFGADLVQETFANASSTAQQARDVWVNEAGSESALVERVARVMRAERADLVVTLDPLHGGTCHGEHRAAGVVALAAAESATIPRSRVLLVSSVLTVETPTAPSAIGFLPPSGGEATWSFSGGTWQRLADVMRTHASQFSSELVAAAASAPPRLRTSYFRTAESVRASDALDTRYCP
ncbi:MAG: PIG-L family deacetylase [Deltaproteobacteria bacterium]|nr:PIG-L family deacetylase [Deltaproteobacteria bacterium]